MSGNRIVAAVGLLLAAVAIFLSALLFTQVNQSRVNATYDGCVEQNDRHDKTLHRLDQLLAAQKDPVEKARAQRNLAGTKALIEALAPYQDCMALVHRRFGANAHPD